jgi:hypothetical protein
MDQLALKRYCCRRMVMTHVDLIEKLLKYGSTFLNDPSSQQSIQCKKAQAHRITRYNPADRDTRKAAFD